MVSSQWETRGGRSGEANLHLTKRAGKMLALWIRYMEKQVSNPQRSHQRSTRPRLKKDNTGERDRSLAW